jgi:hypothetical protein
MPDQEEPSLGEPIRAFRVKMAMRVLIGFCGLVLILLGVGWIVLLQGGYGTAFPIVLGVFVVGLAFVLPKQEYLVCPGGVMVIRGGNKKWCRCEEITEIIDQRVKHGIVSGRVCVLVRKSGANLSFSDTGISDFGAMIALLREQAAAHSIPWREEKITK